MAAKRLYRNTDEQMIAGVCAGIADYFDVDPTIVRILFAVFGFTGGAGVFAYILCWIIVPDKKMQS